MAGKRHIQATGILAIIIAIIYMMLYLFAYVGSYIFMFLIWLMMIPYNTYKKVKHNV